MIIETIKGAKIELAKVAGGKVTAAHNGRDLGVVVTASTNQLGWHLRAGDVAIAVAPKHVEAVKVMMADHAAANAIVNESSEQRARDAEMRDYQRSHDAVTGANYGSY